MSTFNTNINTSINVNDKKQTIAVSATESWFGFAVARRLLLGCGKKNHITIRCLTKNPNADPIKILQHLGGEIHEIDYDKEDSLENALCETRFLVFVNESDERRVKEARCLAQVAAKNDVCNVIVNSIEGAGDGHGTTQQEFKEIEKAFQETVKNVVVIRSALIQQAMFLWSRSIEENGEIIMTPREKDEYAPFNIEDLGTAIIELLIQEGKVREELSKKHHKKCYLLTGPNIVNGRKLAEIVNQVSHGNVSYHQVTRHRLEEYLKSLDEDSGCAYELDNNALAQRDAAYLIQGGLALFRQAMAEFFRGTQRSINSGRNDYYEGINRLDSAVRLLGDIIYRNAQQNQNQNNKFDQTRQNRRQLLREVRNQRSGQQISQNVQSGLRSAYGQNDDQRVLNIQSQRGNRQALNDTQFRTVVDFVNQVEDVLERLRSINVENIELLDRASRYNILNNLKDGTEIIEVLERQSDIVPLLYNTTYRDGHHYQPFLPLSKFEINLVADYLDYVKEGRAQRTDDYHKITGERPIKIQEFFENNANCFRPPKRRGDRNSRL